MVESIRRELVLRKDYLTAEIETIYFGGGTPSILGPGLLESILDTLHTEFKILPDAEITLEANPDDLTYENSKNLFDAGINRLSIGLQSFSDDELRFMNRAHNAAESKSAIENVRRAGFNNLSIDLIYGIPGSPHNQWEKNLETAFGLEVDHLSCYALTVEPKTALADLIRKKKIPAPDDEKTIVDFELLMEQTSRNGYEHYEISNFARNGKYSRHNTSYWQNKYYLGVGPSAHSYNGASRQWNVSNNQAYIRSLYDNEIPYEIEILSEENKLHEYVLTSLRTMWGLDLSFVQKNFGTSKRYELEMQINSFVSDGLMIQTENKYILTKQGKIIADRISSELFI